VHPEKTRLHGEFHEEALPWVAKLETATEPKYETESVATARQSGEHIPCDVERQTGI
jgi:hypothetical protein